MKKRPTFLERLEKYRNILSSALNGKSEKEIRLMLCHCRYYKMGRTKNLTPEERILYDFLTKNKLSPSTLYKNFLPLKYPKHIQEILVSNKISMIEAQSRAYAHKRMISTQAGKELMTEVQKVIGGLEWRNLNAIVNRI